MFNFSSFKVRAFFCALILAATFCFGSTAEYGQSSPDARQTVGAFDPLLNDYKTLRQGNFNPLESLAGGGIALAQRNDSSPSAGELDASLNVNIDSYPGNVRATLVQPDGKILVAGYFRTVNGIRHKSIVRLNADYSLDATFSANVNGTILAVAVQPDGKIIVGGAFLVAGGANRSRIARLNPDGSLDASFNPGTGADGLVYDVAVQPDGKILLGGNFYTINSANNYGIARLNANGSVDASFVSPIPAPIPSPVPPFQTPGIVYSIAIQPDGKIVVGGFIVLSYNGTAAIWTPMARLNQNGAFDSTFNSIISNSNALKVAIQPDGKILMAGSFSTINGISRNFIARFNPDGALDPTFNTGTGPNQPVFTFHLQPDGKILLGGIFSSINGTARSRLARLNADGSLDMGFAPSGGFSLGTIQSIFLLPNGKVLVGGSFGGGFFSNSDAVKLFNSDGSADAAFTFNTSALGGVRAIAVQPDGKILVGGNFTRPQSNASLNRIFRLNADGTLDTTFGAGSQSFSVTSGQVNSIIVQPDGKILLAGLNVSSGGGFLGGNVARLNADGTADASFAQGEIPAGGGVNQMALQPDGKIVVVWGANQPNRIPSGGVARLNADGSVDNSFSLFSRTAIFNSVAVQPDGKILVGGPFTIGYVNSQTGSVSYHGLFRLNADGSHETAFVPATTSSPENNRFTETYALAVQADGKILVGGRIFTVGATAPVGAARLNADGSRDATFNSGAISSQADLARVEDVLPLPNGKILVGGVFNGIGGIAQTNVARLNADGSVDAAFNASADNTVYKIAAQSDGKILIGGDFETVNGTLRTSLARLLSEPSAAPRTRFDFDGDGKADISVYRPSNGTWYLLNSQSGFTGVSFGISTDRIAPADFDGDGKTDVAVFRNGTWYIQRSQAGFVGVTFGDGNDVPQPADFDGDGKAEIAVYRPSNGTWYVYNLATNQTSAVQFGASEDKPVAADYDGDGKSDIAVFRPSNGTWYLQRSTLGFTGIAFGEATDKPAPADYDGDGKADVAVFRQSNGTWYLQRSQLGFIGIQFGASTDLPVPADYDGDGKADVSVFRPSNGAWYLQRSQTGFTGLAFGASDDKPVPNAFVP